MKLGVIIELGEDKDKKPNKLRLTTDDLNDAKSKGMTFEFHETEDDTLRIGTVLEVKNWLKGKHFPIPTEASWPAMFQPVIKEIDNSDLYVHDAKVHIAGTDKAKDTKKTSWEFVMDIMLPNGGLKPVDGLGLTICGFVVGASSADQPAPKKPPKDTPGSANVKGSKTPGGGKGTPAPGADKKALKK